MPNNKPLSNKQAPLKEWLPIAIDESNWIQCIDDYFNSCRNIINLDELDPKNMNEPEPENEPETEVPEPENEPENEVEETEPASLSYTFSPSPAEP